MKVIDVVQGSDEWLELRLDKFTASEAAAMMGVDPYMSRTELLDLKKGWQANPIDAFKQRLFNEGHEKEDDARLLLEFEEGVDYPPIVGMIDLRGLELLASYDGLPEDEQRGPWEHKQWNETLSENVRNGVLEDRYTWQLEQQLLVSGRASLTFMVSDGTSDKRVSMKYVSDPEKRAKLIAGWEQFAIDLEAHELTAKAEAIQPRKVITMPVMRAGVENGLVVHNMGDVLNIIRDLAMNEKARELKTDEDFVSKNEFNKRVKESRQKLKQMVFDIRSEFVSFKEFTNITDQIDKELQQLQSHGEKQVRDERDRRKEKILRSYHDRWDQFYSDAQADIPDVRLHEVIGRPDFVGAAKGKSKLDSINAAMDAELARIKAEASPVIAAASENMAYLRETHKDFMFLFFGKLEEIVVIPHSGFRPMVDRIVSDHVAAEKEREEQAAALEQMSAEQASAEEPPPQEEDAPREQPSIDYGVDPIPAQPVAEEGDLLSRISEWGETYNIPSGAMMDLRGIIMEWQDKTGGAS